MKYIRLLIALNKRLLRKPSFILLLVMIPVVTVAINGLSRMEKVKSDIGVYFYDDSGEIIIGKLQQETGVLNYVEYKDIDQLIVDVKKEKIDCGFAFSENFVDKLLSNEWSESIYVYKSDASFLVNLAQENISAVAFEMYSEKTFDEYVIENMGEETFDFAKEKYLEHLFDSSTASIEYYGNVSGKIDEKEKGIYINIKGILAVLLFLGGLNSLLLNRKDLLEKRFVMLCSNWKVSLANISTQTFMVAGAVLISMVLTDTLGGAVTLVSLFLYSIIVIAYCFALSFVLRTRETIALAIPILALLSLICCPVILDLSVFVPVFGIVNKFFPPTFFIP